MKKGSISPAVLFLLIVALAVSLLSALFSVGMTLFGTSNTCEAADLEVVQFCVRSQVILLNVNNLGPPLTGIKLYIWSDVDDEVVLPDSDLSRDGSFQARVPFPNNLTRMALTPFVRDVECTAKTFVVEEVEC